MFSPKAEQGFGLVIWTANGMLCTCAECSGLKSVYQCQPTQLVKEAFLREWRLADNQNIRKDPMQSGPSKMLGYSIAVVVHLKPDILLFIFSSVVSASNFEKTQSITVIPIIITENITVTTFFIVNLR